MNLAEITLIDNAILNRFELPIAGEVAFIEYQKQGKKIYLVHTEVPTILQGQGIASGLVKKVMQWIEKNDLRMIPYCPYVLQFLKKHPEYIQ